MADRIKGITIEIGGDTSKLSDSLKDVNRDLKNTQSALKDVDKLLKFDPGNVDLLRQKQEYLSKATEDVKEKLAKEKEALEQMKSSDSFDKNSEQAKALERQIAADEQQLRSLKEESKSFGSVASQQFKIVGEKVKDVGEKISNVGSAMSKKVTAPITAVGAASVAAFKEVDAGLDIVVKKTGATGEEFESMKEIVEGLAGDIPADFQTIGTAVGEVNTRFQVTGDELQDLSKLFLEFSEVNGTDVTNSVDQAQKALAAFGLSAEDAGSLLDTMTYTGQQTGASMESLLNGLVQNGTAFQEMGLSIQEATIFMGQMETSGANSETVMQGLRKALKNSAEDGLSMNESLAKLQDTILNGTDSMDGLTAAYDLFGKSGDQIYAAVKNGTIDFTNLSVAAGDLSGTLSTTFESTLDPMDKWKTTLNEVKVVGAELGGSIGEVLLPIVSKLSETVKDLTDKFKSLTPEQQQTIVKIGMIIAAVGPALLIIGKLVSGIGSVISILGTIVGVLGGPVTIAITAIIAVGVLLYKNWDTIKEKATQLKQWVSEKWTALKESVSSTANTLKENVTNKFNAMKENVSNKFAAMKTAALDKFEAIKSGIVDKITSAKDTVHSMIEKIKGFFNFHWELPHLKLPHFSVSGSMNPIDWFTQGVPHISVEWYRKAYDNPVMFTKPTVLQTPGGYKGFGDGSGAEIVMSLNKLREVAGQQSVVINVYGAQGQDVRQLAKEVEKELVALQRQRTAVYA